MQAQASSEGAPASDKAEPEPCFHPLYNDPTTTDLVLASSDGMRFRVHSVVLATASSVFRQMVGVQRDVEESSETPVQMEEDAEVLGALLDVFYPDRLCLPAALGLGGGALPWGAGAGGRGKAWKQELLPPSPPFHILRALALAADKYDMPGVMRVVRGSLFVPVPQSSSSWTPTNPINPIINNASSPTPQVQVLLANPSQHPPVELYALARRLEWVAEARAASTATLACTPLLGPHAVFGVRGALESMDAASAVLLLDLHARRRAAFVEALDVAGAPALLKDANANVDNDDVFRVKPENVHRYWAGVRSSHKGCRWNMYKDKTASPSRSVGDRNNANESTSTGNTPGTTGAGAGAADAVPPTPTTPSAKGVSHRKDALPCREHLQAWLAFTQCALAELDRSLAGKVLRSDAFWGKETFGNLWTLSCPNVNCAMQLVSRNALKAAVLRDLDALPSSI